MSSKELLLALICITCLTFCLLSAEQEEVKSDEYSVEMQQKMGGFLTYRHEDGMNFALVLDNLIVGSCLQTPVDLDRCAPRSPHISEACATLGRKCKVQQPGQVAVSYNFVSLLAVHEYMDSPFNSRRLLS